MSSRIRRFAWAAFATAMIALTLPLAALAQAGEESPTGDAGSTPAGGHGGAGGGLAGTGFEAWQVGLLGLGLVVAALVLFRRTSTSHE